MRARRVKREVEHFWRCEDCYEEFETKALARNCECTIEWECGDCGEIFDTKKEAAKCCNFND